MEQLENLIQLSKKFYGPGVNVSINFDEAKFDKPWNISVGNAGLYQAFDGNSIEDAIKKAVKRYTPDKIVLEV